MRNVLNPLPMKNFAHTSCQLRYPEEKMAETNIDARWRGPCVVGSKDTGDLVVSELGAGFVHAKELELRLSSRTDGVGRGRRSG